MKTDIVNRLAARETYIVAKHSCEFQEKKNSGGRFDYRWKAENLIRSSAYSWVASHTKLERSYNYFSSYRVNKNFFESLTFDKKIPEQLNGC